MVTQEQIARKLGISRQLVTLALRGYPQVSARSRERVLAAARKMGYRPNPHARALKRGRTGIVGLWVPDQISSHYNHVARHLGRIAREANQEFIITEIRNSEASQLLSHVPLDGIFAVDAPEVARAYASPVEAGVKPIVSLGAVCSDITDAVQVDLRHGAAEMMEHLFHSGFKRIAHATWLRSASPDAGRRAVYEEAMERAGLEPEFIYYDASEQQRDNARCAIKDHVSRHGCPEAIFCHSDDAAVGIYRGLCDLGLRVPGDVALAGCDGIEDTEYLESPLTTLVQPVAEMCAEAWKFFTSRLDHPGGALQRKVLQPTLAIRASTDVRR